MDLEKKTTLTDLSGGALQEMFENELQKVIDNVSDLNTPWKTKRSIVIKIDFEPVEDRALTVTTLHITTKLAPTEPVKTTFLIGEDSKGKVIAAEYMKQAKGQTYIDQDTGEIMNSPQVAKGFNRV